MKCSVIVLPRQTKPWNGVREAFKPEEAAGAMLFEGKGNGKFKNQNNKKTVH